MFALLCIWFLISFPLVWVGVWLGYRKPLADPPVKTNMVPRVVPLQAWYLHPLFTMVVGGILPFGAVFVELFFILSSMWMNQYYYVFGFTLLVFVILIITCCEITIVLCYFQLCSEDYQWWWRSFMTSGSTALYVMIYSAVYFSRLEPDVWLTYMLYFGYMTMICLGLFMLTGSAGFASNLWFTRKIYASIKVD